MVETKIEGLLEQLFKEEDFQDCFLIDMNLNVNNKLEVFVDSDTGIPFSKCQKISRYLEEFIDEEGWLGERYVLEVSSPGVGRPLKMKRQYPKNIGRTMEVTDMEGVKQTGILTEVKEEAIVLEYTERVKEGKKNVTKTIVAEISFENINKALVKISFKK